MLRELMSKLLGRTQQPTSSATTDYAGNRETQRTDQMSTDDRAWEEAASERNRTNEARTAASSDDS